MGFGPFLGVAGKARVALDHASNTLWTGRTSYDVLQAKGVHETVTQGLLGIGLGVEYSLTPTTRNLSDLWPYASGEILLNVFPSPHTEGIPDTSATRVRTRIGLAVGLGVEFQFSQNLTMQIGLALTIANAYFSC